MTDKIVALDIETESLTPEKIWCICAEDVQTGEKEQQYKKRRRDSLNTAVDTIGLYFTMESVLMFLLLIVL